MLTTDLIRVRRKKGELLVVPLRDGERARLLEAAEIYLSLVQASVGQTRAELYAAWDAVTYEAQDFKLHKGVKKLIEDKCTFAQQTQREPRELRRALFRAAASARRSLRDNEVFVPETVQAACASELGITTSELTDTLYGDLDDNHRLTSVEPMEARALVETYERAQKQAVLLRATRVVVLLRCADAAGYRLFFRRLKFHRLLYQVSEETDGRYRIEIDGPFSLFSAVTKYGLQLALLLPVLEVSGEWELDADILWEKETFQFRLKGAGTGARLEDPHLPDDVRELRERFAKLESPWKVELARTLVTLPGAGLCVPDLVFTHKTTKQRVYLEVMGFWSRAAVWRRVELVQAGLAEKLIFAVSSRLRVSEEVLDDAVPSQLYVYKGVMSAAVVLERLERMAR